MLFLQVELGIIINTDQLSSALPSQNYACGLLALVVWSLAAVVLVTCLTGSQIEMECVYFFICGDDVY